MSNREKKKKMRCPYNHHPPYTKCDHCALLMSLNHCGQALPACPPFVPGLRTWRPPELRDSRWHYHGIEVDVQGELHSARGDWCSHSSHARLVSNEAPHPSRLDNPSLSFSRKSDALQPIRFPPAPGPPLLQPIPQATSSQATSRYSRPRSPPADLTRGPSRTERPERDSANPPAPSSRATEALHCAPRSEDRQGLKIYGYPPSMTSSQRQPSHSASQSMSSFNNSRTYPSLPPESSARNRAHNMETTAEESWEW